MTLASGDKSKEPAAANQWGNRMCAPEVRFFPSSGLSIFGIQIKIRKGRWKIFFWYYVVNCLRSRNGYGSSFAGGYNNILHHRLGLFRVSRRVRGKHSPAGRNLPTSVGRSFGKSLVSSPRSRGAGRHGAAVCCSRMFTRNRRFQSSWPVGVFRRRRRSPTYVYRMYSSVLRSVP